MQRDPIADSGVPPATFASSPEDTIAGNDSPQPPPATRVEEDMGTLAIHPGILNGDLPSRAQGRVPAFQPPSAPVDLSPEALQRRAEAVARGDLSVLSDAEVMLELKAGNMAAFDVLLAKYRRPIVHFMFRMVHNQGIAEELAQEVFLRVYRSRETYRAEARFSTWLYRIATNLGVNHARDTRRERTAPTVHLDEPDAETGTTPDLADDRPTIESTMLRRERMNAIREHVMALPERQRTAVLLHKYEGLDYKGIGEVLKLSESATKSLLFRAYQTLREKLKGFI
ncbi:MAG: RNA polymerase sigma factor [Janthinobacterium lividum]